MPGTAYFCTTNTYLRHPWFEEPILREGLAAEINKCQSMHNFYLHGYAIMPDHLHIMFMPREGSTHSEVMKSLKKQSSHNMNRILGGVPLGLSEKRVSENVSPNILNDDAGTSIEGAKALSRLQHYPRHHLKYSGLLENHDAFIRESYIKYIEIHGAISAPIQFKWHKSFHDHYIRDAEDFIKHLRYIEKQEIHHGVEGVVYVNDQKYEGEKALSRLRIFETDNLYTPETGQNPRIELIARAVGDGVHVSRF